MRVLTVSLPGTAGTEAACCGSCEAADSCGAPAAISCCDGVHVLWDQGGRLTSTCGPHSPVSFPTRGASCSVLCGSGVCPSSPLFTYIQRWRRRQQLGSRSCSCCDAPELFLHCKWGVTESTANSQVAWLVEAELLPWSVGIGRHFHRPRKTQAKLNVAFQEVHGIVSCYVLSCVHHVLRGILHKGQISNMGNRQHATFRRALRVPVSSSSCTGPLAGRVWSAILGPPMNISRLQSEKLPLANPRLSSRRCGICCTHLAGDRRLRAGGASRLLDPHIMVRSRLLWLKPRREPPPPASRRRQHSQLALPSTVLPSAPRSTRPRASSVWRRLVALHRRTSEQRCHVLLLCR